MFIEIDRLYVIKLHILTILQIATLSVINRDTRHTLRHFLSQIETPSEIATITNCYVTRSTCKSTQPHYIAVTNWDTLSRAAKPPFKIYIMFINFH